MNKIIDSHMHISKWGDTDFISFFDDYRNKENIHAINLCAIPFKMSNVSNNIMLGFYKLARPNTYVHGGIELINVPIDNMPKGMTAVDQYKELMEIGFDGIKMLEGKPTEHKRIGKNLNHPSLNALYKEMEKDGTHLLMHVNDPDEFWDLKRAPEWAINCGWTYTDGTYSSYEEIHNQTVKILEDYPNLSLTVAHFFFCSKEPDILERLFSLYPNFCVDLTPGGEMYVEFEKNYDYYKSFFNKYSNRLIFGTDCSYLGDEEYASWLFNVVTTFLGTDKSVISFDDKELKGLGMTQDKTDNILFANFERRVGKEPKPMDKKKFKAYIEKYSFALTDEDIKNITPLMEKYL
ncbi:MAG: amidohydrolase family protein [Clostridia bacterium]|nr:amidohydrolase family protein [Clostridia bacterium]